MIKDSIVAVSGIMVDGETIGVIIGEPKKDGEGHIADEAYEHVYYEEVYKNAAVVCLDSQRYAYAGRDDHYFRAYGIYDKGTVVETIVQEKDIEHFIEMNISRLVLARKKPYILNGDHNRILWRPAS